MSLPPTPRGHQGRLGTILPGLLLATWLPAAGPEPARPGPAAADPCAAPLEGPVRVQIGTVEVGLPAGSHLTLPVRVKGVCDLARFSFGVNGGGDVIRLVRIDPAPFLAGKPEVEIAFVGLIPGAIRQTIQGARPPGTGGVDGIGTLARLTIFGLQPGVTQLALERVQLWDPSGALIPTTTVPVRITVTKGWPGDSSLPGNRRAR